MDAITKLRELGYTVEVVREGGERWLNEGGSPVEPALDGEGEAITEGLRRGAVPAVYHVDGFGITMQVEEGAADTWQSLIEHHDEVAMQDGETWEETRARQERDGVLARVEGGGLERVPVEPSS